MKKDKIIDKLLDVLIVILSIATASMIFLKVACVKVIVDGTSMNPTIVDQSEGYMFKVNENTKIERFDVVASEYGTSDDYYIIKRVLGLPGEQVQLIDNVLFVNGEVVEQEFSFNKRDANFSMTSWTLAEDEYLIVGDNRRVTINPAVVKKSDLIAINGFSYSNPEEKGVYLFKDGI